MSNLITISQEMNYLANNMVEIGILGEDKDRKSDDPKKRTTILEYAVYNEFGTKKMPARPFMRTAIEENKEFIRKTVDKCLEKILQGRMTGENALKIIGETVRGHIIETIKEANRWAKPLDSKTLKAKLKRGSNNNKTLLEDRFLIRAIRYKIIDKRGITKFISDFKEV